MKTLELTEESIKSYGSLLHKSNKKPAIDDVLCRWTADVYKYDFGGDITVGILTGKKREIVLDRLERHVRTAEVLIQVENDAVIYLAKGLGEVPRKDESQAFYFKQGEAIALAEGVWHWIPFPIKNDCKTLVIYRDGTSVRDYEAKDVR